MLKHFEIGEVYVISDRYHEVSPTTILWFSVPSDPDGDCVVGIKDNTSALCCGMLKGKYGNLHAVFLAKNRNNADVEFIIADSMDQNRWVEKLVKP